MGKVVVRVQITRIYAPTPSAEYLIGLCVSDGKRELLEYLENPSVAVYMAEDVGLVCVLETPDTIDLLDIAVHPDSRKRGIGRALVKMLVDTYNRDIMLEVRQSNLTAIAFYESLGFERISVRKKYYSAPIEDALIYRRKV